MDSATTGRELAAVTPHFRWRVSFSSTRLYWICQIGGWGVFYVLQFLIVLNLTRGTLEGTPAMVALGRVHEALTFIVITHLFRMWVKRHDWKSLSLTILFPRLLVSVLVLASAVMIILYSTGYLLKPYLPSASVLLKISVPATLAIGFANCVIVLSLWIACYFGVAFVRQSKLSEVKQLQLSQSLQFAELRLLKSQLNPHFLFNSLNSVRALIAEDPERAQTAVTQLARTLRYTLSSGRDEVVSLERELEIVKDYLQIESLRLAERLKLTWNIAPQAHAARIPIMLLQTLVENAVKHGISQLPAGGELRVSARVSDDLLLIEVVNDRSPAAAARPSAFGALAGTSSGIGLVNAAERLRLMFGPPAALQLNLEDPKIAIATVCVPQGKRITMQPQSLQV